MGNLKDGLRGLLLAAVLIGFFLVLTMMLMNSRHPSAGEEMLVSFLMGFACARALAWFLQP
jgi:hypothetical protein